MSRSGYIDDCCGDNWRQIIWRGAVASAMRGRRGQAFLRELLATLDAMPDKRLIADSMEADGCYCALGAIGSARGMPVADIDPWDHVPLAKAFGIAEAMAQEIMYENDECGPLDEAPEARWLRMRDWVASQILSSATEDSDDKGEQ